MTDVAPGAVSAASAAPRSRRTRAGMEERVGAGAWAASALGILGVAAMLSPERAGHGTHVQLGLPGCVWMGTFDAPCPTCGMTTAFSFAAHGDYGQSFLAQPFGALLAIGAATTFWIALHTAVTGSRALPLALRGLGGKALWLALAGLLVAWVYKLAEQAG